MMATPLKNYEAYLRWRDSQTPGYLAPKLFLGGLRNDGGVR